MLMLDLDEFKIINDTRGHAAGNLLLVEVAARLQSALGTGGPVDPAHMSALLSTPSPLDPQQVGQAALC